MSFNKCSNPSDLRITDMRFVDIDGAPKKMHVNKDYDKSRDLWLRRSARCFK